MGKTILVLSVSAGEGHVRAAEALCLAARRQCPANNAAHVDVLTLVPGLVRRIYRNGYLALVKKHPLLWGYLYEKSDLTETNARFDGVRRKIENLGTGKLRNMLKERRPDAIICTHFLPAQILSDMLRKKEIRVPVWVQVTDHDVHSLWIVPGMAGYIASDEGVAFRMQSKGIAKNAIHVLGIPVRPVFEKKPARAACARELGVPGDAPTFLLLAGSAGAVNVFRIAQSLLRLNGRYRLLVVAGKNAALLSRLKLLERESSRKLVAVGYTDQMEKYLAVADLAVTKPGGLTTAECLAYGVPMLIVSPIPGQEERNSDYLLENCAALKVHDLPGMQYRMQHILDHPGKLAALAKAARRLGRPFAARDVIATVLRHCGA